MIHQTIPAEPKNFIRSCVSCQNQNSCEARNVVLRPTLNNSHFDYAKELFENKPSFQETLATNCHQFSPIRDNLFK